jgi:methyl-accepting chemotaxis protein
MDIQAIATSSKAITGNSTQVARSSSDLAQLAANLQSVVSQFKVA